MRLFLFTTLLMLSVRSSSQLIFPADGGNTKSLISTRIGITDVTVDYHAPGVKGRDGKIWGQLVHYGFIDQGFGISKAAPWRAGANENTTITFSTDVILNKQIVPSGTYGVFIAVGADESSWILSKNAKSWGSYFYDPKADQIRIPVRQTKNNVFKEWLTYSFTPKNESSADLVLEWERWSFSLPIEVDLVKTQLASLRNQLSNEIGFNADYWVQAVDWCANRKVNLEEALTWADYAINGNFVGEKTFPTLRAKARILDLLGRSPEALTLMNEAIPLGDMNQIHQYARALLTDGKKAESLKAFEANYKKYPNTFTTNLGMTRALSANGKYPEALKYAQAALTTAPATNKSQVESMIKLLKEGKDVN